MRECKNTHPIFLRYNFTKSWLYIQAHMLHIIQFHVYCLIKEREDRFTGEKTKRYWERKREEKGANEKHKREKPGERNSSTHLPPTSYSKAHQITPDSSNSHLSAPSLIKYASPHLLCPWPSNKPSFPFPPSGSGPPVQSPYSHP